MQLGAAMIASTFGRGQRPLRSACIRLGILMIGALAIASLLARLCAVLPIEPSTDPNSLFTPAFLCMQVIMACTLLCAQNSLASPNDTWRLWILSLPIGLVKQQLILLIPQFILTGLTLLLTIPPLWSVFGQLGATFWQLGTSILIGVMAAFGLVQLPRRLPLIPALILIGSICLGQHVCGVILASNNVDTLDVIATQICLAGSIVLSIIVGIPGVLSASAKQVSYRTPALQAVWWPIRKICRNQPLTRNAIITFFMSIAVIIVSNKLALQDGQTYAMVAALLGAAYCGDLRSASRHHLPPEGYNLTGSLAFVKRAILTGCLVGGIAISPLLWAMITNYTPTESWLLIASALLIGCSVSIVLAPGSRDITSQCVASFLALGIIFGIPQFAPQNLSPPIAYIMLTFASIIAAYTAEYTRNSHYWRSYNVFNTPFHASKSHSNRL